MTDYEAITAHLTLLFEQVEPLEFYRDLFGNHLQDYGALADGRYKGICICVPKEGHPRKYLIDNQLTDLDVYLSSDDFTVIAPVSYCGKTRDQKSARQLFSLTADLDGIRFDKEDNNKPWGLIDLLHQVSIGDYPMPTYIIASGNNIHCYWNLVGPLDLWPETLESLNRFRKAFITDLYNRYVTTLYKTPQIESSTQAFRAVGTICKDGLNRVIAFRTGKPITIEELNEFVKKENQIIVHQSRMTIAEAKKAYPDWVAGKKSTRQGWYTSRAFYDWWKNQLIELSKQGARYNGLVTLCAVAQKCGIKEDELTKDIISFVPIMDEKTTDPKNHFTIEDAMKALESFFLPHMLMTRETISLLSGIEIKPAKRNGRTRTTHQQYRRAIKEFKVKVGECLQGGRPSKRDEVIAIIKENPTMNITELSKTFGISRPTLYKYLRELEENND